MGGLDGGSLIGPVSYPPLAVELGSDRLVRGRISRFAIPPSYDRDDGSFADVNSICNIHISTDCPTPKIRWTLSTATDVGEEGTDVAH